MVTIPSNVYIIVQTDMKLLLEDALERPVTDVEADFEANLVNGLVKDSERRGVLERKDYFRASRKGTTLRLTRKERLTIELSVNKLLEKQVNNYMFQEYGYC